MRDTGTGAWYAKFGVWRLSCGEGGRRDVGPRIDTAPGESFAAPRPFPPARVPARQTGPDNEFSRLLEQRGGRITGGAELVSTRRTRVVRRGPEGTALVTNGPYAESVEQLAGFYLVSTDDEAGLIEATKVLIRSHPVVEIRPIEDSGSSAP